MRRLALFGASGHGKVVADAALASGWDEVLFFDDAWPEVAGNGRWQVVGDFSVLKDGRYAFDEALVSIGNCDARWRLHQALRESGVPLATVVHPRACVSPYATLGVGSVVMAGAVINVDAVIGEACIINTGATVDHDCRLADAVHVSPGAHMSGGVSVGLASWIGVGATVRQGMRIGAHVMVGAGAVVVKDVADNLTVTGCPASAK